MSRWLLFGALILTLPVFGQPMEFDAASVKPAAQVGGFIEPIKESTPGQVTYRNYVLKKLLMEAYQLTRYQVEGPPWIERDMYDIIATKPRGATADQERQMLRSLLAARFHLAEHQENRQIPGYLLLAGKDTSKLHPVKEDGVESTDCQASGTMSKLAEFLALAIKAPVIDQTGIAGRYYFVLMWSDQLQVRTDAGAAPPPPPPPARPSSPGCPSWTGKLPSLEPSIFDAVKEQMGLRLERRGTTTVSVMVLDRVEKASPN